MSRKRTREPEAPKKKPACDRGGGVHRRRAGVCIRFSSDEFSNCSCRAAEVGHASNRKDCGQTRPGSAVLGPSLTGRWTVIITPRYLCFVPDAAADMVEDYRAYLQRFEEKLGPCDFG